jgi:hypothetical protein
VCPELRARSLDAARHAFREVPLGERAPAVPEPAREPPSPLLLSPADVGKLLNLFPLVEDWMRSVRAHADELARVGDVPGWKLVRRVGNRRWRDPAAAELALLSEHGIDPREAVLVSPAEAERRGKKKYGAAPDLTALTERPDGGAALVEEADPRPALRPGAVFLDDPAASATATG